MKNGLFTVAAIVMLVSMLVAPGVALAAGSEGTGPDNALDPNGMWAEIGPGQTHWYAFLYDGEGGQIDVRMDVDPTGGAMFKIVTPAQLDLWQRSGDLTSCGCSTANDIEKVDGFWSGNFNTAGTYYIVVEHTGAKDGPAAYALIASGQGVTVAAAPEAAPSAMVAESEPAVAETVPAEVGSWMSLPVGMEHWFSFYYDGDGSQIEITLAADPDNGATFSVWTSEQVRRYSLGEDVQPVGRGSQNEFASGDLVWSGSFTSPGKYFVRVDHRGAAPTKCMLDITGSAVTY